MSLKGFSKAIARMPQQMRGKMNMGDVTKDPVFIDAQRRFKELQGETKKLHEDAKKYASGINGMLDHQLQFADAVEQIYKPISGRRSDPNSETPEGNLEGIEACRQYKEAVMELKKSLQPELELLETRISGPADELLSILKTVDKMIVKRDHKQLDYDRHRNTFKKLSEKKDRSLKDEKALYSAENASEVATQEFEYYNEMLKTELPRLFELEAEFVRPLFQTFYFMQLNIYYTLYERMNSMNITYFGSLEADIEEAFEMKRGDVQERAEALDICHFSKLAKTTRAASGGKAGVVGAGTKKYEPPPSLAGAAAATSTPPAYSSIVQPAKAVPPVPSLPTKAADKSYVTALYDYAAQSDGDLSFKAGDRIEVVQRTADTNDWWTGLINGMQGLFPANYVEQA